MTEGKDMDETEEQEQKRQRTSVSMNDEPSVAVEKEINPSNTSKNNTAVSKKHQQKNKGGGKVQRKLFSPGLQVVPCDRHAYLSLEKRFRCRYTIPNQEKLHGKYPNSLVLDALVLDNHISVLMLPYAMEALEFAFSFDVDMAAIVGKFKRGSRSINALDEVATVTIKGENGTPFTIKLLSPIEGKVSEQNTLLPSSLSLLKDQFRGDGYIAVLVSEAPSIINKLGPNLELESEVNNNSKDRVCFAWTKGSCKRGSGCKFLHTTTANQDKETPVGEVSSTL